MDAALDGLSETVQPFLSGLNGATSTGRASRMAFDILERFYYHSKALMPLLKELEFNHNMAVPLSQIFRAMVYDAAIGYWLFGESAAFETRMDYFNYDYIKKNSTRVASFSTPDRMQNLWKDWQAVASNNFTEAEDGSLAIATLTKNPYPTFESICELLIKTHPESFIKSLPLLYAILSQQAHVSEFSKLITYNRYDGNLKAFDSICKIVLHTSLLLLNQIVGSENTQTSFAQLLNYLYPGSANDMKHKLS